MKRNLSFTCSIFGVVTYLLFTILATRAFPGSYSPLTNWLSDLGSNKLNPSGAMFYNVGIATSGLFTFFVFLGLHSLATAGNKKQNVVLFLTQVFGCLGSLAMVMSALFPITMSGVHSILSAVLYILLGTSFALSAAALRYYSKYPKGLLLLGILIAVEDLVFGLVLNIYILEWVTVILFLSYILVLGIATRLKPAFAE